MNSKLTLVLASVLLLLFGAYVGGCDSEAAEVMAVDDEYDHALDSGDGKTAASFLSKASIERLDRLMDVAKKGSRKKVEDLPISERIEVLRIRLMLSPEELKKMSGRDYYIKAVDLGWQGSTSSLEREKVVVNKNRATITYWDKDTKVRSHGVYVLEDGAWKEEPTETEDDAALLAEARERSMTENQFVEFILCQLIDEDKLPDSVWSPPR